MVHTLPPLPYGYDALEPAIDAETMRLHHDKHHQTYVDKFNVAVESLPRELRDRTPEELLTQLTTLTIDEKLRTAIRNHGGGHANHAFFWTIMGPKKEVDQTLVDDITTTWGSLEAFKKSFQEQSVGLFGSGWTWLVRDAKNALRIHTLPNQDSPLSYGLRPILALDLWEHAYYLKYQNKRADYIAAWWSVLKLLP